MVRTEKGGPRGRTKGHGWIELFGECLLLVDPDSHVVAMNRSAARLLCRSGIAFFDDGRLRFPNGKQGRVDAVVAHALARAEDAMPFVLRCVENGEWLYVFARKIDGGRVLLLLSDGKVEIEPVIQQRMRGAWALSEAEGRVAAAVVEGVELKAYATANGVSPHTVRTQLNTVFAKTGVRRQADLVRLVLSGPAAIGEGSSREG